MVTKYKKRVVGGGRLPRKGMLVVVTWKDEFVIGIVSDVQVCKFVSADAWRAWRIKYEVWFSKLVRWSKGVQAIMDDSNGTWPDMSLSWLVESWRELKDDADVLAYVL